MSFLLCLLLLILLPLYLRDPSRTLVLLLAFLFALAAMSGGSPVGSGRVAVGISRRRVVLRIGIRLSRGGGCGRPPGFRAKAALIESGGEFTQVLPQGLRQLGVRRAHRYVDLGASLQHADGDPVVAGRIGARHRNSYCNVGPFRCRIGP